MDKIVRVTSIGGVYLGLDLSFGHGSYCGIFCSFGNLSVGIINISDCLAVQDSLKRKNNY